MSEHQGEWAHYRHIARTKQLLGAEEERTLLELAKAGNQRATAELVQSHMRLVVQVASTYARSGLSVHDLVSEGTLGLMEAIRRFDLARGTRFASYAAWWVRACVRQHALANRRIVRMPDSRAARLARARMRGVERRLTQELGRKPSHAELAQSLGITEHDIQLVDAALSGLDQSLAPTEAGYVFEPPDDTDGPEQAVSEAQQAALRSSYVKNAIARLTERERAVVCEHVYTDEGHSLAQLGRSLGVSRQRAGQILAGARAKLRAELSCVA